MEEAFTIAVLAFICFISREIYKHIRAQLKQKETSFKYIVSHARDGNPLQIRQHANRLVKFINEPINKLLGYKRKTINIIDARMDKCIKPMLEPNNFLAGPVYYCLQDLRDKVTNKLV